MLRVLTVAAFMLLPVTALAANHGRSGHGAGAAAADVVDGEVRRIDKDAGKITLRHGPLPNLDMPAMTMVFQVPDRTMLEKVSVGDKVRFETQKVGGQFTVTRIDKAP